MTTLALVSDFLDYYDHAFDALTLAADTWPRHTRTAWTRPADFRHLEEAGLHVPRWGPSTYFRPDDEVVIYDDEHAHRGEGKRRGLARDMKPGQIASALARKYGRYVAAESYRAIGVGARAFWLRYRSDDAWRSNVGNVEITEVDTVAFYGEAPLIMRALAVLQSIRRSPLVAIDFVNCGKIHLLAVDVNTAPGLRGTPVEAALKPGDVFDLLKARWLEIHPDEVSS